MKKIAILLAGAALITLTAAPAAAQIFELGGGATQQWWNGRSVFPGFAVDFAGTVRKMDTNSIAIVVDVSRNVFGPPDVLGFPDNEEVDTSFVGGVRFKFMTADRVSPFVQVTTGVMHWAQTFPDDFTGNDFVIGGGGGVQIKLTDLVDVKGQIDVWIPTSDFRDPITRFYIGAVLKFGPK